MNKFLDSRADDIDSVQTRMISGGRSKPSGYSTNGMMSDYAMDMYL